MKLYQKNLWTATSHEGSSLDVFDAVGGLSAGTIRVSREWYSKAKGIRVWTTKNTVSPESHTTHNGFTASIGGKHVASGGEDILIQFDTATSSSGQRGIYKIDGAFEKEHHWDEVLTKGEAAKIIEPHHLDIYEWDGANEISPEGTLNVTGLVMSTPVADGHTTIEGDNMRVLPAMEKSRAVMMTVILTGDFPTDGPHPYRVEIRQADGVEVERSRPTYSLVKGVNKVVSNFVIYTNGTSDAFSTTGFRLYICNDSTVKMTIKYIKILANALTNPDFS